MNKLKLDDLAVESFDTTEATREKGTVFGEQCTCQTVCTCPGCNTCDVTCANTCDDNTCLQSCYGTCAGTCQTCSPSCWDTCGHTCLCQG